MEDENIFVKMNRIVSEVGNDPAAVAEWLGATVSPAYLTINGMVTKQRRRYRIAINPDQESYQRTFSFWHEDCHVLDGHLEMAGFTNEAGFHIDTGDFSKEFTKGIIAHTERIANLGAANQMIDTDEVLDRIGYYALAEYREARKDHWSLLQRYQQMKDTHRYANSNMLKAQFSEAHRGLKRSYEKLMDLEDQYSVDSFMTISQIAEEFEVPDHYIEYKLEALRLQGYDIDVQELKSFENVFNKKRVKDDFWGC